MLLKKHFIYFKEVKKLVKQRNIEVKNNVLIENRFFL